MKSSTPKCTNSEVGWYNQECGKPATWSATTQGGNTVHFCDDCKERGWEAMRCKDFVRL